MSKTLARRLRVHANVIQPTEFELRVGVPPHLGAYASRDSGERERAAKE